MGQYNYRNGFELTLHEAAIDQPRTWKKPRLVFVNSMSDLFHKDVPLSFIKRVFDTMKDCAQHRFQVLTKRAKRLALESSRLEWPENVWMGVSVENSQYKWRIDQLRTVPAAIRFLSIEPLLGPVGELNLDRIHWVIVGGESGPSARPMEATWVIDIRNQCVEAGVPFFFKQWGGVRKDKTGRELEGQIWSEMPEAPKVSAG